MSDSDILGDIAMMLADANRAVMNDEPRLGYGVAEARRRLCAAIGVAGDDLDAAHIRAKLSVVLRPAQEDWLADLSHPLVQGGREMAIAENDPELLSQVDRIMYASWLLRQNHRVADDDWLMWGSLADHLEWAAHIPERTGVKPMPWQEFNRAGILATGIIRIQDTHAPTRRKLLSWVMQIGSTS